MTVFWQAACCFYRDDNRKAALSDALTLAVRAETDDWARMHALCWIVQATPQEDRARMLGILFDKIHSEVPKASGFRSIVKLLRDSDISFATNKVNSFNSDEGKAEALAALLPRTTGTKQEEILHSFLRKADKLRRFGLLRAMQDVLPVIVRLEGTSSLMIAQRAVCDAGQMFP